MTPTLASLLEGTVPSAYHPTRPATLGGSLFLAYKATPHALFMVMDNGNLLHLVGHTQAAQQRLLPLPESFPSIIGQALVTVTPEYDTNPVETDTGTYRPVHFTLTTDTATHTVSFENHVEIHSLKVPALKTLEIYPPLSAHERMALKAQAFPHF